MTMTLNSLAEGSSRIFIRNLPQSLSETAFKSHFSHPDDASSLTDSRFFPNRRIGYVGYKTPEDAQRAVKYFNKTFIGTTRINVEIARAYTNDKEQHATKDQVADLKRKRDEEVVQKDIEPKKKQKDAKLSEFLQVMGTSKGEQSWKDNDLETPQGNDSMERDHEKTSLEPEAKPNTEESISQPKNLNQSDDAWLRSKTSKVLDVQEETQGQTRPENNDNNDEADSNEHEEDAKNENDTEPLTAQDKILRSSRLYLRNLPFNLTEEELRDHFSQYGELEEIHIPIDVSSGRRKGFAFLLYSNAQNALDAYEAMDGKTFQGRLLHILPADDKKDDKLDEFAISKLPLKQQQKIKRKMESASSTHKWNPLYMNMDDVMSSISARMGVAKSELLDATSSDAAVKQALAETHIIQEAKSFFSQHGVDLDTFKPGRQRGDTAILVKNFPHGTTLEEIRQLFEPHGQILRLISPPSGTMALVEFAHATQGRNAFAALKYKRIKNSILFLEKAPKDVFSNPSKAYQPIVTPHELGGKTKLNVNDLLEENKPAETTDIMETSTLFVRNLNFTTTTEKLRETFSPLTGFISARVKTKPDPKNPGQILSMGFGFVEFKTKSEASAALAAMDNHNLEGHKLEVRPSQKTIDVGQEKRRADREKAGQSTKVMVKNIPFEASKAEIRALLGAYGKLRSVRLPKKFDSNSRGFAFAEFTTPREAAAAMEALRNTHLLGRRLHMEYANEETADAEEEIERMQKKVGAQVDKIAIRKLTDSTRHKFRTTDGNDEL